MSYPIIRTNTLEVAGQLHPGRWKMSWESLICSYYTINSHGFRQTWEGNCLLFNTSHPPSAEDSEFLHPVQHFEEALRLAATAKGPLGGDSSVHQEWIGRTATDWVLKDKSESTAGWGWTNTSINPPDLPLIFLLVADASIQDSIGESELCVILVEAKPYSYQGCPSCCRALPSYFIQYKASRASQILAHQLGMRNQVWSCQWYLYPRN